MHRTTTLLIALVLLLPCTAAARTGPAGTWLGSLKAGAAELRIVFHIADTGKALQALMDSPDQGVKGIPAIGVQEKEDSLIIAFGFGTYRGLLRNDSTMDGTWMQGQPFPLTMRRTEVIARVRPQTPVPPFPYKSEDLTFTNGDKRITYGATLTAPTDGKKHPALLLVTGSGQQNRDEEIMEHKPFAVIADYLTRRGYVVLRVDDRGVGQTTGNVSSATTADFALDAAAALDYLKHRPEVDAQKLGVLGHSEGGMIATILAAQRKDLAFIISMAGPGVPNLQTMVEQNDAILKAQGLSEPARKAYLRLYRSIMKEFMGAKQGQDLKETIEKVVREWRSSTPDSLVLQTTGIKDEATAATFTAAFRRELDRPWYAWFMAYDPAPYIRKISAKVLALNGENDIQVISESNLAGWRNALKESKAKAYKVQELPRLNHLFQECVRCAVDEYGALEQTIAPAALSAIGDWLDREVK